MIEYFYLGNCTSLVAEHIDKMTSKSVEISIEEFFFNLSSTRELEVTGFTTLELKTLRGTQWFTSTYKGHPCQYCVNSAIEYVFI